MSNSDRLTGPDFLDSVADQSDAQGLPVNAAEFRQRATDWRADQARIEQLEADLARLERQLRSDTERARIKAALAQPPAALRIVEPVLNRATPGTREAEMAVLGTDENGVPTIWCDPEIADLVRALNVGGVRTVASCSGHGERLGSIALADGRALVICSSPDEAIAAIRSHEGQQPAAGVGEEIMVNAAHDVYTLPLQPSGLSSGPRFVVHVPGPEQQPAAADGVKCPWDGGSPCVEPMPAGMVYPKKPAPRAGGYLDTSGVEWNAWDAGQMEAYARAAYSDGWEAGYRAALSQQPAAVDEFAADRERLLRAFMMECGIIGAKEAGVNLARGIKAALAAQRQEPTT